MKKIKDLSNFKFLSIAIALLIFGGGYSLVQATILSTDGFIEPPDSIYTPNTEQQAFNEAQGVTLSAPLDCDFTTLPSGETVNSHMIFLNTSGPGSFSETKTWTFENDIICVMENGVYQLQSDGVLGADGTTYTTDEGGSIPSRGFDAGDSYTVNGKEIVVTMNVNNYGDWLRVVTRTTPTPVDETAPVLACEEIPDPNPKGSVKSQEKYTFFELTATDETDNVVDIYLQASTSAEVFGSFPSGTIVKYIYTNGGKPRIRYSKKDDQYIISAQTDAIITATDQAGNSGSSSCGG